MRSTLLVAGGILCTLVGLTQTDWGRDRMRDLAVQAIGDELGLDATFGQVRIDLRAYPPGIILVASDISLDDPEHGTFAEAEELRIHPSLLSLIRGELDLEEIEIDEPAVHLIVRDGTVINLPQPRITPAGGPGELPLRRLLARRAQLTIDAQPFADLLLDRVDIELLVSGGTQITLMADGRSGRLNHTRGVETLQRYIIAGSIDPERGLELERLLLRTPHYRVEITSATVPLPFDGSYAGEIALKVELSRLEHLPMLALPPIRGLLEADVQVNGTPDGPTGQGDLRLTDARVDGYGLGQLVQLAVDFDPQEIRVPAGEFHLIRDGGVVRASGSIGLDPAEGLPLDFEVGIDHLQFAKLMEQLGVTPNAIVQWDVTGQTRLRGTLDPLDLSGPIGLRTRDFLVTTGPWHEQPAQRVMGVTRARLDGEAHIRPAGLSFEALVGETPGSRLRGDVLIGFDNQLRVNARLSPVALSDVSPLLEFPLAGVGSAEAQIRGTFSDPVVTGHLQIDGFEFDSFRVGDVESDWHLEEEGLAVRFPAVEALKGSNRYRVEDLLLDFTDDRLELTGLVQTGHITLADVYHIFRFDRDERFTPFQATASGRTRLRYTRGFPSDGPNGTLVADLDLQIPEADIDGFHYTDGRVIGRWRWLDYARGRDGGELTLEEAYLHKGAGVISLSGRMNLGSQLHMNAVADQIAIRDTEGLRDRMPELSGSYAATMEIRGTASIPRVHMDVGVTGMAWDGADLGDGRFYVRLTDREDPWIRQAQRWDTEAPPEGEPCPNARAGFASGRWRPDPPLQTNEGPVPSLERPMAYVVCGELQGGQVGVDLAVGRTAVLPLRGQIELRDLVLDALLQRASGDPSMSGHVTGRIALSGGAMRTDDSLVGQVLLTELQLGAGGVELRNQGDLDLHLLGPRGFEIAQAMLVGAGSELRLGGRGSTHGGLALEAEGSVDLALLASLSPMIRRASGQVGLEINVRGPMSNPAVFGEARVQGASFLFAAFPDPIEELEGRVLFSSHRVLFEDFSARLANGQVGLSGMANLHAGGIERYLFDMSLRDVNVRPGPDVELAFGGQARLEWAEGQRLPRLSGALHLDRARYGREIQLSPTIGALNRAQRTEVQRYDPAADMVELDVQLETRNPIHIANSLFDAEIEIDDAERSFRIVGTDQRYGVIGNLDIARGLLRIRDTALAIREADIRLDDPTRVDPHFDLLAVTEIRRVSDPSSPDWRITLRAHGSMDGFQLDLGSEPQMSQEDIMLLLTFGMTRSEVDQLQAGDLGTYGLDALSNVTGVSEEVTRTLRVIDEFGIRSIYSERTNRPEPHVTIGKRISDRIRLTASTGLTGEQRDVRASAVMRINDSTSVEASYDNVNREGATFGNVGVDLRWRLEFE